MCIENWTFASFRGMDQIDSQLPCRHIQRKAKKTVNGELNDLMARSVLLSGKYKLSLTLVDNDSCIESADGQYHTEGGK